MKALGMTDEVITYDPYALPAAEIQEPPATTWAALRKIGPGIILAGTIVGSGELILTTGLGAKHGFVFLWLILFSCVIKVFVQIELGRYAISSGKPTLGAINDLPGRTPLGHPLVWWWFIMMLCTVFQLGGMTGGIGQALNLAFPNVCAGFAGFAAGLSPALGDFVRARPELPWAVLTCIVTTVLIYHGSYKRIEWLTTVIVVGVTLITVSAAVALGWTEYPIRGADVMQGFEFQIPAAGLAAAFAVFGITGVGATELFYYPYWCLEKGYARYTGVVQPTEEWERRAKGWIRVMHLDAWVSMVVFTVSTVSFYMMGAAVLRPQGLDPKGAELINTLSKMYIGPFGMWTRVLFLIGAGAVLFKTLYLSCAANSRLTADFLTLTGIAPSVTPTQRMRMIQRFCLFFPALALFFYIVARDPQLMVKVGGIAQAVTLPMIALVAIYFRYVKVDKRLLPWKSTDLLLWIAVLSILAVAAYAVPNQLRDLAAVLQSWIAGDKAPLPK
jgi:manganese transport protein